MSVAGWLPTDWAKAIIPLAMRCGENFIPIGTAFLVDCEIDSSSVNCLVTAKHVVFDENGVQKRGIYVLASRVGGGTIFTTDEQLASIGITWKTMNDIDLAVALMPANASFDIRKLPTSLFEEFVNLREGDDVFFMGFPLTLGVSPAAQIRPIVRSGIIAMRNDDRSFLVDGNIFPGSSGSPVFFRPCLFDAGTQGIIAVRNRPPKLLGVLTSAISYIDEAISRQTGRTRVYFEENSGLGTALSAEFVRNLMGSTEFQGMVRAVLARGPITL